MSLYFSIQNVRKISLQLNKFIPIQSPPMLNGLLKFILTWVNAITDFFFLFISSRWLGGVRRLYYVIVYIIVSMPCNNFSTYWFWTCVYDHNSFVGQRSGHSLTGTFPHHLLGLQQKLLSSHLEAHCEKHPPPRSHRMLSSFVFLWWDHDSFFITENTVTPRQSARKMLSYMI